MQVRSYYQKAAANVFVSSSPATVCLPGSDCNVDQRPGTVDAVRQYIVVEDW